jgi:hypothetical protein
LGGETQVYANGGAAIDLSYSILAETINHLDNCYNVPHFRAVGKGSASRLFSPHPSGGGTRSRSARSDQVQHRAHQALPRRRHPAGHRRWYIFLSFSFSFIYLQKC